MKFKALSLVGMYFCSLVCLITLNYYALYSSQVSYRDINPSIVTETQNLPQLLMDNLKLLHNNSDIILVGNSRVKYNIDSSIVSAISQFSTYNSGMASFSYFYWPTILPQVLSSGEHKAIVFVIEANYLYLPVYLDSSQILRLRGKYNSLNSLKIFIEAYYAGYVTLQEVIRYSMYTLINYLNFSYLETAAKNIIFSSSDKESASDKCGLAQSFGAGELKVYHCASNDGYMVTERVPSLKSISENNFKNSNISTTTLFFLQKYIQEVKNKNYKAIIVVPPTFGIHTRINVKKLQSDLATDIIDMSNVNIANPEMWSDAAHLSTKGRAEYSKILAKELKAKLTR